MNSEAYFPRGGTDQHSKKIVFDDDGDIIPVGNKVPSSSSSSKSNSKVKQKNVQPSKSHPAGKISSAKKFTKKAQPTKNVKAKRVKTVLETLERQEDDSYASFIPERLSTKKVTKGTMVLGAVKEIRDYEIRFNLPNNVIGSVSITNMADGYTGLLKRFAQSTDDQSTAEELRSLNEIFKVGQVMPCVCVDEANDSQLIQLSINPKNLHEHLTSQCLRQDLVLYGAVNGVEDHGYQVDIGVPNITAFMASPMTTTDLCIGMMRRFRITESDVMGLIAGDSRTVNVTLHTEEYKNEHSETDLPFNSLVPGMLFEGKIHARKTEGIVIKSGQLKGFVHVSHLGQHVKDYSAGEKVKFRVLSVNTATKYIQLTGLTSLLEDIDKPGDGAVDILLGEPITTTISRIVDKYAFVSTEEGHLSYMGVSLLPEKVTNSTKQNETKVKCFWFGWDYLEQRPIFSTVQPNVKKSVLPTLVPGDNIDAKIARIGPEGAKVKLASGLHAFVQNIHLTEVPLKNPEKKLSVGKKLHCRILTVNLSTKRVRLTAKPSLVTSSLPVLSELQAATVGSVVQGVIVKLTTGALVSLYNDVVGFVSAAHLAKEPILEPANAFYIGQSVTCRVLSCDVAKDKLALTFILDGDVPHRSSNQLSKRKADEEDAPVTKRMRGDGPMGTNLTIGQIVQAWSVVSMTQKGYNVLSGQGHRALLPRTELSDMPGIANIVAESIHSGTVFEDLVCITDNSHPCIVSNKLMFKYYSAKDGLAKDWQNLKVGGMYPASVVSHTEHGIFVSFGNGLVGLSPERLLPQDHQRSLVAGKSVLAKVVSVDTVKQRMIVRLRSADCTLPESDSDLVRRMLAQNLADLSHYQTWATQHTDQVPHATTVSKYRVGDVVKGTIVKRGEDLVGIRLKGDVNAESAGDLMSGCAGNVGEVVWAVVVYVDLINGKLDVLTDKQYVLDRRSIKSQSLSAKVKVGQQIKSEIVYTRPEYMLALLRGHANGRMAYIPTLQHPNSIFSASDVFYGQENKVIIKQCDESSNFIIATLQSERDKQQSKAEQIQAATDLPATGSVVDAVITSKQALQLNLKIGSKAIGRVFINEVQDNPKCGVSPLDQFKINQTIKVKVIGAKMIATTRKLRTIKDSGQRVMLDCSIKQRDAANWKPVAQDLTVGKHYTCYVTEHDTRSEPKRVVVVTSVGQQAVISWLDAGQEFHSLADFLDKFPVGVCVSTEMKALGADGTVFMQVTKQVNVDAALLQTSNTNITAMVVEYKPSVGLFVSSAITRRAKVPLSEMSEPGVDLDLTRFKKGLVVSCRLVRKSRHGGVVMSMRQEVGLLKLEDLESGIVLSAIVSSISPTSARVMAAGHMVQLALSASEHKLFAKQHRNGSACWIRMTSTENENLQAVLHLDEVKPKPDTKPAINKEKTRVASPVSADKGKFEQDSKSKKVFVKASKRLRSGEDDVPKAVCQDTEVPRDVATRAVHEKIVDEDTGVEIVIKRPRAEDESQQRRYLDFGAGIKSLQGGATRSDNGVETKLDKLEQTGKTLKREDRSDAVSARKPKLALVQMQTDKAQPQSEAEYLLILKKSPNSGSTWAKLIAFSAEYKGVEAARARAEQALETVSYRLENEKMVVWSAFLRLEIVYGTEDSLDNVKRRATQQMDELKVYQELVKLHTSQDNSQEVEQCYTMMLRKWSGQTVVWVEYGQFLFSQSKIEAGRTLLQRCLKTLPVRQHIEAIMKFAQMEMKWGEFERFTSLFENIISNFPKRTDVWSVYVDQLIKSEKLDPARAVLRRAVMQKWNSKKIQFFVKKFKDFETLHGTTESLAEVEELVKAI